MENDLRHALRKNGIFTTVLASVLIAVCISFMIMGIVLWNQLIDAPSEQEDVGAGIAMVFVVIILIAVVLIIEGVCGIFLLILIPTLIFGINLIVSKNINAKIVKRKKRMLVVICVFLYILFVVLLLATLSAFISASSDGNYVLAILCLLGSIAMLVFAILETKNNKELNRIVKELESKSYNQLLQ